MRKREEGEKKNPEGERNPETINDLDLDTEAATAVRGGTTAERRSYDPISNIMKTKHDTVKNSISNVR